VGPTHGIRFEIVTEREVAQHLEERHMSGGRPDDVDIDGPNRLLHRHRPVVRRLFLTQKVGLERHHPGVDEQQSLVSGNDWRRRTHRVAAFGKEFEKGLSDRGRIHGTGNGTRPRNAVRRRFRSPDSKQPPARRLNETRREVHQVGSCLQSRRFEISGPRATPKGPHRDETPGNQARNEP
jgi:hypothetical protein